MNEDKNNSVENEIVKELAKVSGIDTHEILEDDGNKNKVSKTTKQDGVNDATSGGDLGGSQKSNASNENADAKEEGKGEASEKVETRGRHKLECQCEKCKLKRGETSDAGTGDAVTKNKVKNAQGDLVSQLSQYKTVTPPANNAPVTNAPQTTDPNKVDLSKYISGALLLICMDAVFPTFIIMIAGFVDKKYKRIKTAAKKKLKLTNDEKEELEPLADEIIKVLFGMVHPAVAFIVATGIIYAGKIFSLDDDLDFNEALPLKKGGKDVSTLSKKK